ncbi:MAG: hypothetical protein CL908_11675 [Deltaproteobacteria bacterium]|nr:hypothetical protein [Deltaproteobacteria bacterium]
MKNAIGKKNILFGLVYFLTTLGLGLFMANKGNAADPEWAQSTAKQLLGTAHSHGNMEALLNVLLGYLICRLADPSAMFGKVASVLLLVGAVFHSGTIYLAGAGLMFALNLTPVGAFSMVFGVALMIPIVVQGIAENESP